jgi:hypothetical protein
MFIFWLSIKTTGTLVSIFISLAIFLATNHDRFVGPFDKLLWMPMTDEIAMDALPAVPSTVMLSTLAHRVASLFYMSRSPPAVDMFQGSHPLLMMVEKLDGVPYCDIWGVIEWKIGPKDLF